MALEEAVLRAGSEGRPEAASTRRRSRRRSRRRGTSGTRPDALAALARLIARRAWWVLAVSMVLALSGAIWGAGVFGSLTTGGFTDSASESTRASTLGDAFLGTDRADLVMLYAGSTSVDEPAYRRAVDGHLAELPSGAVAHVTTYWTSGSSGMVSPDRRSTYAVVQLTGHDEDGRSAQYRQLAPVLHRPVPGLTVQIGGPVAVSDDVTSQIEHDIARAESISIPVTLGLLVVIFGGLVAAGLPVLTGGIAIVGSLALLRLLTLIGDVSVFSVNIVAMLGLGLSIDYALFVVSRYREELRAGRDVEGALVRTLTTAGRTVAFSGLTVAIALASLLLFPQVFLRSMGFGGMAAVLVAMLSALTVLPALLAVLGHRVDSLRPWRARYRGRHVTSRPGWWHQVATTVMRWPVLVVTAIVALLLLLGSPFLGVRFGPVDYHVLPPDTPSRVTTERLASDFPGAANDRVDVVLSLPKGDSSSATLTQYRDQLSALPGVTTVSLSGPRDGVARLLVAHGYGDGSDAARNLVETIRGLDPPLGAEVLVGGTTAEFLDLLDSLARTLPWMLLAMGSVTLVLLFLAFGSVALPVKAVLMNVLSLAASFGAVVWIFQKGHLAEPLGLMVTGTIDATQPLLMLAVAFGLSMDYEVFLLSRVREEWDRTGDNNLAVAGGLQHTGRIITTAALLLVVVVGAFSTSGITFIRMLGVGLVIAIIVDATLVRTLLVPATMRLLGSANWWAPAPLASFWRRYGFRES